MGSGSGRFRCLTPFPCVLGQQMARRIIIIGGGAAGFFAAITAAEAGAHVTILEKSAHLLSKVKISGGGRCNVTHAPSEAARFAENYPRGQRPLIGALSQFSATDAIEWFARRGVKMYTQEDGCLFPVSDDSQTIIDCFLKAARDAGVNMRLNAAPQRIERVAVGFCATLANGETLECERLLLATGGCRVASMGELAVSLGHTLEPPVPSLFTFHIEVPWLQKLAGIVVADVEAGVPAAKLGERGILLITHWGVSGPVILRLSAWGARKLAELEYKFTLQLNWLPELNERALGETLDSRREESPAKLVVNTPVAPLTARLWEALVLAAGVPRGTRWSALSKAQKHSLMKQLMRTELPVSGKSLNKDEFVTCGGVKLSEVNFKTMESKLCPGLYFAGELLDIDGITGGFNFQACWTTGYIAGKSMSV
jgi:predicted Rossmann fold flavoprotein